VAIQEFIIGPQNYFEPGYFNGDYTEPNVSRAFLQCDIDNIRGGRFVTGEYYLGNYIDGSYYHNNSIKATLVCDALKVKVAKIDLGDYYSTGYFTDGYFTRTGFVFSINCVAGVQILGQAQISASASTSTAAGRINQFAIALTATFTQSGTISHIEGADLFAFSNAQLEAAVRRIRDNNITASAVFSVATDTTRIRNTAGDDSAQFSFTATTVRSRDYASSQSAAFSLAANTFRIKSLAGTINSAVTVACTISHIEGADLVAFANAAVSTDVVVTKSISSTQTATFTQDTNNSRLRDHSASQSAAFAFSATIDNRTRDQSSAVAGAFAITAIISHTKNFNLTGIASGEFTSSTVGNRIRFGLSSINSEFTQTAAVRKIRDAHLTGTGIAAIVCDAVKISRASSSQTSQFTQNALIGKRQTAGANLAVYASIFVSRNVGLSRNRPFNLEPYPGRSLTFDSSVKKFGSASFSGFGYFTNKTVIPTAAEDFYIETWVYWPTGTGNFGITTTYFIQITLENIDRLRITFQVPTSINSYPSRGYTYLSSNNSIARNVWHHIAIVKTQTSMSYYFNGTRVSNFTEATIPDGFYGPNNGNYWGTNLDNPPQTNDQFLINAENGRVDELLFVRNSTYGYSPSSTTIDVPTQARVNSSNVQFLYHFDGNAFDDLSLIQTANSSIQSQATVSAAIGYRANFYSNLVASSSVVAVVGKLNEINLVAFTDAAVTTNANIFKGYNAECSASSSVSVAAVRIKQLQADLTAAVTVASTPNRLRETTVALSTSVAVTAQVNAIRNGVAGISANSTVTAVIGKLNQIDLVAFANGTITATAVKNTVGQSSITSAFTQTALVVKTANGASNQSAQFSQNAAGVVTRNAVISTQAVSSQLSAVVRLAGLFADDLCEFTVTTVGRRTASAQGGLETITSQLTVTAVKIKQLSSALQSSATVTANTVVVKISGGSFSSNFAQSAAGNRIRFSAMSAVVVSEVIATGNATGKIECTLVNAVTLTATAMKMVGVASTLPSAISSINVTVNRTRNAESAVNATSAVSVSGQTVIVASAAFATVASQLSVVIEISGLQAELATVATMIVQGQRIRRATATIQTNSQVTAQGGYRSNFGAALTANGSLTANAGYRVSAGANIQSALTFVVTVREIRLDTIVYVVPSENRLYAIKSETRIHKIRQETRIYTI
jgi:hypothetical protein